MRLIAQISYSSGISPDGNISSHPLPVPRYADGGFWQAFLSSPPKRLRTSERTIGTYVAISQQARQCKSLQTVRRELALRIL